MGTKPYAMRRPYRAKGILGRVDGHYYINPASIEVFGHTDHNDLTASVRLTRKQLERALKIMDSV